MQEDSTFCVYLNVAHTTTVVKDSKKAVTESKPKTNDFKKKVETARKIFKK